MPVFITPIGPGPGIGPGITVHFGTDFSGPPVGGQFELTVEFIDDLELPEGSGHLGVVTGPYQVADLVVLDPRGTWSWSDRTLPDAVPTFARIRVLDESGVVDQGSVPITWDAVSGNARYQALIAEQLPSTITGGLTEQEHNQLVEVHDATALQKLLNLTLLVEISPGPTGNPVNANLPYAVFGVIVRMTTVAEDLTPATPDGDYWTPSLAVVRVYRGSDMWLRIPVHTSSKLIPFWTENLFVGITAVTLTEWLLQMTVQVTFREGCTGRVYLMTTP